MKIFKFLCLAALGSIAFAKGCYTTGEAVALICFWLNDKHCGDIIAEWPSVDAFVTMLPSYGYDKDGNYLYND